MVDKSLNELIHYLTTLNSTFKKFDHHLLSFQKSYYFGEKVQTEYYMSTYKEEIILYI